jgi:SAM-dependent methyltransferase
MKRNREFAKELANNYTSKGQPLQWFDKLYEAGRYDLSLIPWADLRPNPNLIEWFKKNKSNLKIDSCLVIGCGLGDDAEYLSSIGFNVESFDISPTAIKMCKDRFSKSSVKYFIDDITDPKHLRQYDFVYEAYTLQVLPKELREKAIKVLPDLLNQNGRLLLISRARDKNENEGNMPWPLTIDDLEILETELKCLSFEDYFDKDEIPEVRRFRILYHNLKGKQGGLLDIDKI